MSDFGTFEAAVDADHAPRRKQLIAARQMSAALTEVVSTLGPYVANATRPEYFDDRWDHVRKDAAKIVIAHGIGAYPAVMREVHSALKSTWYAKYSAADGFVDGDEDDDRTINDKQKSKIDKGEKPGKDDVETNSGDGSDAEGKKDDGFGGKKAPPFGSKDSRRKVAEDRDAPLLTPDGNFDAYLDGVDQGGPEKVDAHDFIPPTSDVKREAMQMVADLYTDWSQSNNLRVASMNTLDVYASTGLHDDDYYLLAGLIRKAECECDDEKDKDDSDDDSDSSDSDDSGSSESSDSDDDSDGDSEDSGSDDSDSGDNPFASSDDSGEDDSDDAESSDDGGNPFGDDSAPAGPDDGGSDFGGEEDGDDEGGPDGFGDPAAAGDPSTDPAAADPAGDVGGQDFTVPDQAPDLPQDELTSLEQNAPQSVPPEVIDDILGLPPGTLEALISEELQGGQGGPPPDQGGPPPQLARRKQRRAAEDPTQAAGADPAAAAQPQMPAAPPAGAGSAGTMPPPGSASVAPPPPAMPLENQPKEDALLDTAVQSVTQMIDQETQEYQQIIDPLTQALQAIQFAQQVETAENPLDVTPPDGGVDVNPSAAPGGAQGLQQQAYRIARRYNLSDTGYGMLMEAMSRKHYEHVGEAIRTLPPEMRAGIADHIGGMFHEDNPRFNHDKWMSSVGVTASRHPFAKARQANPGFKPTQTMDAFEFPGQGEKPEVTDNMKVNDLPKMKGAGLDHEAKGVLDLFDDFTKQRTDNGLNLGDAANVDAFTQEKGTTVGPKALDKLKTTIGTGRKQASFFTRKVPGWRWDDHLAGYISKEARPFTCSCGNELPTPSYGTCRCGKLWNSYAIGDDQHLASNSADMFITREIPVRDDVIMANRKMAWTSDNGWTPPDQRDVDVDWVEDADREDADGAHAPGKTAAARLAWDAAHYAGSQLTGTPVTRHDDPSFQGTITGVDPNTGTAMVQHPGGHHQMSLTDLATSGMGAPAAPSLKDRVRNHVQQFIQNRPTNGGFAGGRSASAFFAGWSDEDDDGWTKYDSPDPSRAGGPSKPPSTSVAKPPSDWAKRHPDGKWQGPTIPARSKN